MPEPNDSSWQVCSDRVQPVDVASTPRVSDILRALEDCSFQGRQLAQCLSIWEQMVQDEQCFRVLTIAGALVPAGMGRIFQKLVEEGLVDAIVSTGANVIHEICNAVYDGAHFLGTPQADDELLRQLRVNRVYDTYIPEAAYEKARNLVRAVLDELVFEVQGEVRIIQSWRLIGQLGQRLPRPCFLKTAAERNVPVFIPAFSDSELALDLLLDNLGLGQVPKKAKKLGRIVVDTLGDVATFAQCITSRPRAGVVILGGGVPRNWAQQVFPFLYAQTPGTKSPTRGYAYGVRIATDRPEFGGLSGCTFAESKSWGKYHRAAVFATVVCDATIALPLLVRGLLERLGRL